MPAELVYATGTRYYGLLNDIGDCRRRKEQGYLVYHILIQEGYACWAIEAEGQGKVARL